MQHHVPTPSELPLPLGPPSEASDLTYPDSIDVPAAPAPAPAPAATAATTPKSESQAFERETEPAQHTADDRSRSQPAPSRIGHPVSYSSQAFSHARSHPLRGPRRLVLHATGTRPFQESLVRLKSQNAPRARPALLPFSPAHARQAAVRLPGRIPACPPWPRARSAAHIRSHGSSGGRGGDYRPQGVDGRRDARLGLARGEC